MLGGAGIYSELDRQVIEVAQCLHEEELQEWVSGVQRKEVTGRMIELSSDTKKGESMNGSCGQADFNTI